MSFHHTKTSFVRPHAKASFIRPLCGYNENGNMFKESLCFPTMNNAKSPNKDSDFFCKSSSLKSIEESKEKHLQNLNLAHSKLFTEIDKIQMWSASVESEYKQKNKKVDELNQMIESQRKVVLDLQMQNENLSLQLREEIQQKVSVMEKFYLTKELFNTLKKQFQDIQGQLNARHKVKKAVEDCCEENTKAVENLTNKLNTVCVQYSDNIAVLNNELKSEKNKNAALKEFCEQQHLCAEKEYKRLSKLIENYQDELKNYSKDIEDEKNKTLHLQQENTDMSLRISHLENTNETNLKKLKDTEELLKLFGESKTEMEKSYEAEKIKVNNLNKKCEELEELEKKQKTEFEETCLTLKATVNSLENSLNELKQKLEESECKNEELTEVLQKREREKCSLERDILDIKKENKELMDKSAIDAKNLVEMNNQLIEEKSELDSSLNLMKEELQKTLSDKEHLSKLCLENDEKISSITKEYEAAISKIKELGLVEEQYIEIFKKVEEMEADIQLKSNLLISKEQEIEEMLQLKLKYEKSLNKIKALEDSVESKSEQIKLKDMKIQELSIFEGKFDEASDKIKELENTIISLKNELLFSKEQKIEEMDVVEQNYVTVLEQVKKMEDDIKYKTELLDEKNNKIADLNALLDQKIMKLDILEYENIEMKDNLQKEKESVKICLECEIMKEKVTELDKLRNVLMDTEKELVNQRQQTTHIMKMLSETEDNFDEMRIKKEKEIIKYKDTIQRVQHELRILKVEADEAEKLRSENEKLLLTIEELTLQNNGDCQRLKTENEKLKTEIESLKAKKNFPMSDLENIEKKKPSQDSTAQMKYENLQISDFENIEKKKQSQDLAAKIKYEQSPFRKKTNIGEIMEADSSQDEEKKPSLFYKRVNKKPEHHSTPLNAEKRKREWETESSGSECVIIFDKEAKKFTPKGKSIIAELKRTPLSFGKLSHDKTPDNDGKSKAQTIISFNTKYSPSSRKSMKADTTDFLNSKRNTKETSLENSPYTERNAEIKRTPSTPASRKFFKTPLKEREHSFKKPNLQKLWLQ